MNGAWGPCRELVNGGMTEVCDNAGLDEDCDGMVDEGCGCTADVACGESDTLPCMLGIQRCIDGTLSAICEGEVPPEAERCDGVDNDCDGVIDDGLLMTFFVDGDGDGVGGDATMQACALVDGLSLTNDDCDDEDGRRFPGNPEICDEVDNDCDTVVDEDAGGTYYLDEDGDSFGTTPLMSCSAPEGYAERDGDCDPEEDAINPGASEDCDLIDNDCSGTADDGGACHASCVAHVYSGHIYQFCARGRRWGEALNDCDGFGDDGLYQLVTINDSAENAALNSFGRSIDTGRSWWIGLTDSGGSNEGTFRWESGSSSTYRNWDTAGGEPNNSASGDGEDCGEIRGNGRWNDFRCDQDRYYICEEVQP